jgi:alpha-tubulin suppressor-like RCC1 family protein
MSTSTGWTATAAGGSHSCAIRSGQLYCWGANNVGQVGDGSTTSRPHPSRVGTLENWKTVAAGSAHTCAIRAGQISCWGANDAGQVGDGSDATSRLVPQRIGSLDSWLSVTAGDAHTCAIRSSERKLFCWGSNGRGQLGVADVPSAHAQVQVSELVGWSSVSAGTGQTCAIRDGGLYCWGADVATSPVRLGSSSSWTSVSAGHGQTCAIRDAKVFCWETYPETRRIGSASAWTAVSTGDRHTCGIRDRKLYCWGANDTGQLGVGTTATSGVQRVGPFSDWTRVSSGVDHTCALRANGRLYCWGDDVDPSTTMVPGDLLKLTNWYLTLPIGEKHDPRDIYQPELDRYSISPYFRVDPNGTGVRFQAYADGSTTENSHYARSELREMTDGGSERASWRSTSGTHTMTLVQAINHVPTNKPHVVAGQIHDSSDNVIMIRLNAPRLYVEIGDGDLKPLDSNYVLGKKFKIHIRVASGKITVTYWKSPTDSEPTTTRTMTFGESSSGWYFKAGCYTLASSSYSYENAWEPEDPDAYGQVTVYRMDIGHN